MRCANVLLSFAMLVGLASSAQTFSRVDQLKSSVMSKHGAPPSCGCAGCVPCKPVTWAELQDPRPPKLPGIFMKPTAKPPADMKPVEVIGQASKGMVTAFGQDNSNGVILCESDGEGEDSFKNCKHHPIDSTDLTPDELRNLSPAQLAQMALNLKPGGLNPCIHTSQGPNCFGVHAGSFVRQGMGGHLALPAPYMMPDMPFPPDSQDWVRPAMVKAREEGEDEEKPDVPPLLRADPERHHKKHKF